MGTKVALVALVVGGALLVCPPAHAYTISSLVTAGCHEQMTTEAFRRVRADLATAAPLATSRDEEALIADLQFVPAADMTDLGGASLLMGVRDNDLHGRDSNDLSQLALVHGDPLSQREHCLRESHDAEPGGTTTALANCRAFIEEKLGQALDGLDADGQPDPTRRTSLALWLSLRRDVEAPLPTYYVRVGQAVHTIEDLFVHSFRTPDLMQATVVVNWIDLVGDDLNEMTEGPAHSTEMDECGDPNDVLRARRARATEAAEAILRTTLDPTKTRDQKVADLGVLLDQWLGYAPGCDYANQWCSAPERAFGSENILTCNVAPSRGPGAAAALCLVVLLAWARRRARVLAIVFACAASLGGRALAQEPPPAAPVVTTEEPRPWPAWGGALNLSGSGTNAAVAAAAGLRFRPWDHWIFGLDAEWNPWIAVNGSQKVRSGAFNGYGTAILRMPLADQDKLALRITVNLGLTHTLLSLYGVPKGTTGFFGAISPLGLEWRIARLVRFIVNPLSFAAPVPQLRGIPFWYPQYRVTIGLEIYSR